ncbi:MAG: hypothetical protein A2V83_10785 [Nitrospirae bacterium RBG_16_64_22]|nr:MAG: hypothetical protein A2V83_10785 [Nitrospirae bacterium RBG_16_64_22]
MKFANVRDLRLETKKILGEARDEDVLVTYRGKPWVIIQKITEDDLEDYILTHHPRFRRALQKSFKEKEAGKLKPLKDLAQELGIEL